MSIFNLGSINVDYFYTLPHLVAAGETLASTSVSAALGGKGANQSVALARAGADVRHAGQIHKGDQGWLDSLLEAGVECSHILATDVPSGHAIVAVDEQTAENQIILSPGCNQALPVDMIAPFLALAQPGDWALAQNEVNLTEAFLSAAARKGLNICYSAAPFVEEITAGLLPFVDLLIVNHLEAEALTSFTGKPIDQHGIQHVIITRGAEGASYKGIAAIAFDLPAMPVKAVDTTGAGDTYLGYVLAALDAGQTIEQAMQIAATASAIQVTRQGASAAIPTRAEVEAFQK
jgi:ribokinase